MENSQVHHMIEELVRAEQELRDATADQSQLPARASELKAIEVQLDRCWDLLRQRGARIRAGANPDDAQLRSESEVEGYRQ